MSISPAGVFSGVSELDGPEDEHFATDDGSGMVIAVAQDLGVFIAAEDGSKPSGGHPWLACEKNVMRVRRMIIAQPQVESKDQMRPGGVQLWSRWSRL